MDLTIHYAMATLSVIFFSIVYIPQIRLNYIQKTNNLALHFIFMWLIADATKSLVAFVVDANIGTKLVGVINTFFNVVFLVQKILYNDTSYLKHFTFWVYIVGFGLYLVITLTIVFVTTLTQTIVSIWSWISFAFFIMAPIIQIFQHYSTKSVKGISFTTFVLLILANITFVISLLFSKTDVALAFASNLPNILKSTILIILYIIILFQFGLYSI